MGAARTRTDADEAGGAARGLRTLLGVSMRLAASLDLEEILQATTDGATELFGLDTAAVYLVEQDSLRLWATTPRLPPGFPETLREMQRVDHPHICRAIDTGTHVVLADARGAELTRAEQDAVEQRDLRTIIYFPLVAEQRPVGTLIVGSVGEPQTIADADLDLCRALAALAALTVENARLYRSDRAYAAELERTIAERDRLERERLAMERRALHAQRLESLGLLAGGVAHDFNNLLMGIHGNLELALLDVPPDSPARARLEDAAGAAHTASELTRQMLAYAGRGRFDVKAMDINELVDQSKILLRSSIGKSATMEVCLDRSLPRIEADAGQLQQVVLNLIVNASDAIGEGAGTIRVSTGVQQRDARDLAQSYVEEMPSADRFVFLEVADNGCGMSEATRARLFDPFFSTKQASRGLGLSAILGIVRSHHGAIFVDSVEGEGTTIRVLFPALAQAQRPADATTKSVPLDQASLSGTVLVADDEPVVLAVCCEMLQALGLRVLSATDGSRAVKIFRERADEIDLVILDRTMPGMDGPMALQQLLQIRPDVKVLIASGFAEHEIVQHADSVGLTGFLQKPYSLRRLRQALAKLVQNDPASLTPSA